MSAYKMKKEWIFLVAQDSSHVERRSHMWCNRCGERMVTEMPLKIDTMVEVMKGFQRAHAKCGDRPLAPVPERPSIRSPDDWLRYGEVGTSSRFIWSVMMGTAGQPSAPSDPDDFRRCHELLECFPDWRRRMPEMATKPGWAKLATEWERLTALYVEELENDAAPKLYKAMKSLVTE